MLCWAVLGRQGECEEVWAAGLQAQQNLGCLELCCETCQFD